MDNLTYINSNKYPIWCKENTFLLIAFIFTIIVVYIFPHLGVPQLTIKLIFLFLLLIILFSQNDIFWLSWFFIIYSNPGRLFSEGYAVDIYRLPMYRIGAGSAIGFEELFLIIYIIKALIKKDKHYFIFSNYFKFIIIYGIFTILYSFSINMNIDSLILSIRTIMRWIWILLIPEFIYDSDKLAKTFQLIAPFVFIATILLFYTHITGFYLHEILIGKYKEIRFVESTGLIRVFDSYSILMFGLVMALFYICSENQYFNKIYLNLIIVCSIINIFLSATRGWILGLIILLCSIFFMRGFKFIKQILLTLLMMGLIIISINIFYPSIINQISLSFERFKTVEYLFKGDPTMAGTMTRVTKVRPQLLSLFQQRPILGFGFSIDFFKNWNMHIGNESILFQGGIIGYSIWMIIFLLVCVKIYVYGQKPYVKYKIKNGSIVFILAMLAMFEEHSTSGQMWGFALYEYFKHLYLAWLLAAVNASLLSSIGNDYLSNEKYLIK